jgi:hypothetical protein
MERAVPAALLRSPVTISALAYDVLWESVVGGTHHPALPCGSPGGTGMERAEHVETAMAELCAAGLAGRAGVDTELLATIGLLNRASRELYGWYSVGDDRASVLGVVTGTRAVVAHMARTKVALLPCTQGRVAETIGDLLPEYSPVRGAAVSVPIGDACADANPRVTYVARLLSAARSGAGEFYLAVRDQLGGRRRAEFPVCYADTAGGRFLTITRRGADRTVWMTLLPADRRVITGKLREMITSPR